MKYNPPSSFCHLALISLRLALRVHSDCNLISIVDDVLIVLNAGWWVVHLALYLTQRQSRT